MLELPPKTIQKIIKSLKENPENWVNSKGLIYPDIRRGNFVVRKYLEVSLSYQNNEIKLSEIEKEQLEEICLSRYSEFIQERDKQQAVKNLKTLLALNQELQSF